VADFIKKSGYDVDTMSTLSSPIRPSVVPPLQAGDRLTRPEFERRFDATPGLKKAELIEGIVYMPPPVSDEHSTSSADFVTLLGIYRASTPGVLGGDNGSVRLDLDNMPQPDAFLRIDPACGGQTRKSADRYIEGAPELVVEIAISSVSYDLHAKLDVYRKHGVKEYLVRRMIDADLDYFLLRDGRYERVLPDNDGNYRSIAFPGLWLAREAILAGDLGAANRVLQKGLATPEHAAFVQRLQAARAAFNAPPAGR
jgi:Uma2 family endonuclease